MPPPTSPKLQERINRFLSSVRVGIDFGQHAGGIAVVRGSEILHAETFLDFHQATLEQRRILRRGRRSRHSKKMRLARLRSWLLRQRLPNGQRIPDPYVVLRDPRYMVQPGVYRQAGADPQRAASWIQLAKAGKTDAEGFVRALTLIFRKRGYKWDAIDLKEMTDAKLKDFLLTARIPSDDLAETVRAQINRRKDDPDAPSRGKPKIAVEELEACLRLACERGTKPPRPRVAEHRSIKEADIRAVVEGFSVSHGMSRQDTERWNHELCGLLNKILRPARFENRLKTGCAWCGKATPRKAKVREVAYRAAVNNLRIREIFRSRTLTDEERAIFLEWWSKPESAPGVKAISERITKMNPQQKGMGRQLADLLKNLNPAGRASLCAGHLRDAAAGKTMKDAGVDWQNIAVRKAPNPCGERRDHRVLHRLEQILFHPGKRGEAAWRFGPVSYVSLEIPEPDTEQDAKGRQKERQIVTLKERLAAETDGCVYSVLGGCGGETDKDHIFPRSRGGPDVTMNLAAACMLHNKEKGNQTPFEWLAGPDGRWGLFQEHVGKLKILERKARILLNELGEYPESDPTALARVGARPRQFVVALRNLFAKYGVTPPRHDYHAGAPLVQRIGGRETNHFRFSWWRKADGRENFVYPKDRSSLFNHAEDAAILAAIPPHTWREHVQCHTSERPNRHGEMKPRPGLALPDLAPNWAEFLSNRSRPLLRILGRYPVSWQTKFADLTFWRQPMLETRRLKRFKLLKNIQRKDFKNIVSADVRSMVEGIAASIGLGDKGTIAHALARHMAGANAKGSAVEQQLPLAAEELENRYPGLRRLQVSSQKGGTLALVSPSAGPARKVQIKPASEGVIVWQEQKGKKFRTHISVLRPLPLQRFGIPRIDPPISAGARVLGQLHRHQLIWLDGEPDRAAGFYRVTKCQGVGVTIQPEEAVPAEIARRTGSRLDKRTEDAADAEEDGKVSLTLGKQACAEYFENRKKSQNDRQARAASTS